MIPQTTPSPSPLQRLRAAALLCTLALVAAAPVLVTAAPARAGGVASMLYDVTLERPLGLVETVLGVAVTGVAYPIALGAGKTDLVVERCIAEPGRYTFTRGIGDVQARPESSCSPVGLGFGLVRASLVLIERPIGMLFGRSPFADEDPGGRDELEVDYPRAREAAPDATTI